MWFCCSREDPEGLRRLVESWPADASPLLVSLWYDDPRFEDYYKLEIPEGWIFIETSEGDSVKSLGQLYKLYPDEKFYGLIDASCEILTGNLMELERLAGDWYVAFPNDLEYAHKLSRIPVIGGEAVRALDTLMPGDIEDFQVAWYNLGLQTGLLRYAHDIVVRCHQPRGFEDAREALKDWAEFTMGREAERLWGAAHGSLDVKFQP